ncbi:MAG: MFS transporter [Bacillota bacterium]|nr:MFS transporter [Bacillota bacterium]
MVSLLIALIFLAFVSLGLPVSLVGSVWPILHADIGVPLTWAGIVSTIISLGKIAASLSSARLGRRLSAGWISGLGTLLTAVALFAFSLSRSFFAICAWSLVYGYGSGAIDAALNHYVTLHYRARHLSWLHCFWGVGAAISPYIMGWALARGSGWPGGYQAVALLQLGLAVVLLATLPLWLRDGRTAGYARLGAGAAGVAGTAGAEEGTKRTEAPRPPGLPQLLRVRGLGSMLLGFFSYCAVETTTYMWASTWLVEQRGVDAGTAATCASLFFIGLTLGRFLSGFVSDRLGDRMMIRLGSAVVLLGIVLVLMPFAASWPALLGLVGIGIGCAPIFPSIIHATPANFGTENAQAIIGVEIASANAGAILIPPFFGVVAGRLGIHLFPVFLLVFAILMILLTERLNRILRYDRR